MAREMRRRNLNLGGVVLGLEVAALKPAGREEDEVAEVEAAALAGDALRDVLPPAGSDERRCSRCTSRRGGR
jgi:hypothetical protein